MRPRVAASLLRPAVVPAFALATALASSGCHAVADAGPAPLAVATAEVRADAWSDAWSNAPTLASAGASSPAPNPPPPVAPRASAGVPPRTLPPSGARPSPVSGNAGKAGRAATRAVVAPTNLLCPVMTGTPVDPAFTSTWQGKTVAFSSEAAKKRWDDSPTAFERNLSLSALDPFAAVLEPDPVALAPTAAAVVPASKPSSAARSASPARASTPGAGATRAGTTARVATAPPRASAPATMPVSRPPLAAAVRPSPSAPVVSGAAAPGSAPVFYAAPRAQPPVSRAQPVRVPQPPRPGIGGCGDFSGGLGDPAACTAEGG